MSSADWIKHNPTKSYPRSKVIKDSFIVQHEFITKPGYNADFTHTTSGCDDIMPFCSKLIIAPNVDRYVCLCRLIPTKNKQQSIPPMPLITVWLKLTYTFTDDDIFRQHYHTSKKITVGNVQVVAKKNGTMIVGLRLEVPQTQMLTKIRHINCVVNEID